MILLLLVSDTDPYLASDRRAFSGKAVAILQSDEVDEDSQITLTVSGENIATQQITVGVLAEKTNMEDIVEEEESTEHEDKPSLEDVKEERPSDEFINEEIEMPLEDETESEEETEKVPDIEMAHHTTVDPLDNNKVENDELELEQPVIHEEVIIEEVEDIPSLTVPEIPSRTDGDQYSASAENGQANDVEILHDILDNQWIDDIEKADIIEGSREAIEVIKKASSIDTHMPVVTDHEPKELVKSHSDETHN